MIVKNNTTAPDERAFNFKIGEGYKQVNAGATVDLGSCTDAEAEIIYGRVSAEFSVLDDEKEDRKLRNLRKITPSVLHDGAETVTGTDIDWSLDIDFRIALTASRTVTFSNVDDGNEIDVLVTSNGAWTITWPTVTWLNGTAVVQPTAGTVMYTFKSIDGTIYVKAVTPIPAASIVDHEANHEAAGGDALPWTTIIGYGATGAKPAAAAANTGYLFFDTTLTRLERSNGTTWDVVERPLGTAATDACAGNDARLSDARALAGSVTQAVSHDTPDTDSAPTSLHHTLGTGANQACAGTDARLSDARTLSGSVTQAVSHDSPDTDAAPTSLHHTLGTGANQACAGNDSRLLGTEIVLGKRIGMDMNVTTDQVIDMPTAASYIIRRIVVVNASISLTTAAGGIYTTLNKGGTALVAAAQVYSALTEAAKFLNLTLEAVVGTDRRTEGTLYFNLTTAQGAAATADVYVIGDRLT